MIHPTYTFQVIAYDLSDAASLPDSRENILFGMENRTIWIRTIDRPMKHGDQFTVSGQQALYLKKMYVDVAKPLLGIYVSASAPTVTTDELTMGYSLNADVVGTITSAGSSDVTDYGFVWAEHDNPTLDDNVESVGTDALIGEFDTTLMSLPHSVIYVAAYATNSHGTAYGDILSGETQICFAAGTKITMANGEKKNIEDVTYDDNLLVWDFDQKKFGSSKPVWMVEPFQARQYGSVKFSDGTELRTVADGKGHRIFNANNGLFTHSMNEDTLIGAETIKALKFTGRELHILDTVRVVGKDIVKENTTFYNIVTHTHFNMFANDILTSTGLNNIYPIVDMQFVKDHVREEYSRDWLKNIPPDIVAGLRLLEQPANYPNLKEKLNLMLSRKKPVQGIAYNF